MVIRITRAEGGSVDEKDVAHEEMIEGLRSRLIPGLWCAAPSTNITLLVSKALIPKSSVGLGNLEKYTNPE